MQIFRFLQNIYFCILIISFIFHISENKQTFSQSFYSRLNHLIEKALSTYSKECQHRKSPASILIKVLTKKSASIKSRRHIEETNRCKNIKMVLRYAHRLLCWLIKFVYLRINYLMSWYQRTSNLCMYITIFEKDIYWHCS